MSEKPIKVSIVVPCRQEARHIRKFIDCIENQDLAEVGCEVIIADGESSDGTRGILEESAARFKWLRVIDNPGRIVSTGLNAAIGEARGKIIIRMDVHTEFAPDYVRQCVAVLENSDADNVGGPWVAKGTSYLSRAIAAVFQSPFGSGGARGHRLDYEGPVDTVYLGCWRKELFDQIGVFDEDLVRNQDDELNLRLSRRGGKIWQSPKIVSRYTPRGSLRSLFKQYFQYGFWKVPVIRKHKIPASIRHLIPGLFVLTMLLLPILAAAFGATGFSRVAWTLASLWVSAGALYTSAALLASVLTARHHGWELLPMLPAAFATYHVAYGSGFLCGLVHWTVLEPRNGRARGRLFSEITR
jgi:glycosyltransferase involved in cell wall biosynthesis